jgi:hypothetical protein
MDSSAEPNAQTWRDLAIDLAAYTVSKDKFPDLAADAGMDEGITELLHLAKEKGWNAQMLQRIEEITRWACGSVLVGCRFCVLVAYRLPAFRFTGVCRASSLPSAICIRRIVHQISE